MINHVYWKWKDTALPRFSPERDAFEWAVVNGEPSFGESHDYYDWYYLKKHLTHDYDD